MHGPLAVLSTITGQDHSKVDPNHVAKIKDILAIMKNSKSLGDLNTPAFRLHHYNKSKKNNGLWSVDVDGNTRILFKFNEKSGLYQCVFYGDPHGKF